MVPAYLVVFTFVVGSCGRINYQPVAGSGDDAGSDDSGLGIDATTGDDANVGDGACPRPISEVVSADSVDISAFTQAAVGTSGGPTSLFFKADGTEAYYCETTGDVCNQISLSEPWSLASAGPVFKTSPPLNPTDSFPADLFIRPDGTQLFILGSGIDAIHAFPLGTAWDLETLGARIAVTPIGGVEPLGRSIFFSPDGSKIYFAGNETDAVHQRTLTTPWDITTMPPNDEATLPAGLYMTLSPGINDFHISPDGRSLHVSRAQEGVLQFELAIPWDLASAGAPTATLVPSWTSDFQPRGIWLREETLFLMRAEDQRIESFNRAPCGP